MAGYRGRSYPHVMYFLALILPKWAFRFFEFWLHLPLFQQLTSLPKRVSITLFLWIVEKLCTLFPEFSQV